MKKRTILFAILFAAFYACRAQTLPSCADTSKQRVYRFETPFNYIIQGCTTEDFIYVLEGDNYRLITLPDSIKSNAGITKTKALEVLVPTIVDESQLLTTQYISGVMFETRSTQKNNVGKIVIKEYNVYVYETTKHRFETKINELN